MNYLKLYEDFEESMIGYTFNVSDLIEKNENENYFFKDLRNLIIGKVIKINGTKDDIKIIRFEKNMLTYNTIKSNPSNIVGIIIGETQKNLPRVIQITGRTQITILSEPTIIVSDVDPFGEEDWSY